MLDISSSYTTLFGTLMGVDDSTALSEFKSIFMPPESFIARFCTFFKYGPKLMPLYLEQGAQPFLNLYIPTCIDSIIFDDLKRTLNEAYSETSYPLDLLDASFYSLTGVIGGSDVRLMEKDCTFIPSDEGFMPVNLLSYMFLEDMTKFPDLSGDMTCTFTADLGGDFSLLGTSLESLDTSSFIAGDNTIAFNDVSSFFIPSFDVTTDTLISDATMLFYPDDNSDEILTTLNLVNTLNTIMYDIL